MIIFNICHEYLTKAKDILWQMAKNVITKIVKFW